MLKVGVLGAGHLGKIHLKLLKEIPAIDLVGFYDPDEEACKSAVEQLDIRQYNHFDELIDASDAVDIVTTTLSHYDCAVKALRKAKHVFIEKPMTNTLQEAQSLLNLAEEANVKIQVGHVERFNPAFIAAQDYELNPMFIETHRLSPFNSRGTDVSVVLDLMIHDIDIALHLVQSNVKKIHASGVTVISNSPDIANARLEFDNGCVANLTASRISVKKMRKMRLFQKDNYFSIDFANKKTEVFSLSDTNESDASNPFIIETQNNQNKAIHIERPEIKPLNSIKEELECFYKSIVNDQETAVSIMDGYKALYIAHQIVEKIEKNVVFKQ